MTIDEFKPLVRSQQFSLANLILVVISIGAFIGSLYFGRQTYAQFEAYESQTASQLNRLVKAVSWYHDIVRSSNLPDSLDRVAEAEVVARPAQFFTNPRFAEVDCAFYTVRGLDKSDTGRIWLYEYIPQDATNIKYRYVIKIGSNGAGVLEKLQENDFCAELAKTLAKPGTAVEENNRRKSAHGWPFGDVSKNGIRVKWNGGQISFLEFEIWRKYTYTRSLVLGVVCVTAIAACFFFQRPRLARKGPMVKELPYGL